MKRPPVFIVWVQLLLFACGKQEAAPPPPPPPQASAVPVEKRGDRDVKPAPASPSGAQVALVVDGAPRPALTGAALAKVKSMQVEGDSGEESRDAWSARDVVATLVGPGARLSKVKGDDGKEVAIDEAAWNDASKVPILRINRRGLVKFFWATTAGSPLVAGEVRGVVEIHAVTK